MNLTEKEILTILQNAHSVPLGSPMWESGEEYDKLVKIIESAIKFQNMKNAWEKDLYKEGYFNGARDTALKVNEIISGLREKAEHPDKEYEDKYLDGLVDACCEIDEALWKWMQG